MQQADYLIYVSVGQRIENILRLATGCHEALAAQLRQMLREGRLAQGGRLFELTDAFLALEELAKHKQPVRIAHCLEEPGGSA